MQWEYKVIAISGRDETQKILNELGEEGWELVNVAITTLRTGGIKDDAYLKRLKQS